MTIIGNKRTTDTIAAIATPLGKGGVAIVRISGPLATDIAKKILGKIPQARMSDYLPFYGQDNEVIDSGIAIYFPAPNSFTGEHILELQGHGGPVVIDMLLARVIALGARLAKPGEFSLRAYLNDKIDLVQAEAIADLIDSSSTQAARMATRSLQGDFSNRIQNTVDKLIKLRMYVEAAIDFPEEEIDFLSDSRVKDQLNELITELQQTLESARVGCVIQEGLKVVIAGPPNAGKSTLLNRLSGRESAIVTDIPGTTRDIIREFINVDGIPLHIIDTAGLRESADRVEQEGIRRAWHEIEQADLILYILDANDTQKDLDNSFIKRLGDAGPQITMVYNKIDLIQKTPLLEKSDTLTKVYISAQKGLGMEALRTHIKHYAGIQNAGEGQFMARRRHVDALEKSLSYIRTGQNQLQKFAAGELLAEELRQAQHLLGEITGEFTSNDLLGKIFSSFCIGK